MIKNGKLTYDDNGDYILGSVNISKILDKIYYADNNTINIKIMDCTKTLFNEFGTLLRKKNEDGFYSYHVLGNDLDLVLFNNTDKDLEITLNAPALKGEKYAAITSQT
jgi:hypothetical protein